MVLLQQTGNSLIPKKRVLLVVRWPVGGIRTFIRYVYRNFEASKWHFTIIAPDVDEMKVLVDDLYGLDFVYKPVRGIPQDGSSGFCKMFRRVAAQVVMGDYDLVHSHGFTSGMCAAAPAFIRRMPHLVTCHETLNANQFKGLKGHFKKLGMTGLFRLIDKIHSVSYDAQENLFDYFPALEGKKGKCIVIPNGIDVERFLEAEPRDLRAELGLGDDVFLIGFMGRFMAPKGFRFLVDAIEVLLKESNLSKRPLVLAFGGGGFIRHEKQSIRERGLENSFCFMPFTPNVASAIKGLDVIAMPSLSEACGLLAMETLVCGKPLIGSDCIGLREVLNGTPAIVVPKANGSKLAEGIIKIMESDLKLEFSRYSVVAQKRFDVRIQADILQKLIYES